MKYIQGLRLKGFVNILMDIHIAQKTENFSTENIVDCSPFI
jgi:hypothetical protein